MFDLSNTFESYTIFFATTIVFIRAERHDLKSRFLLFILPFFFPLFLGGKRKGGTNNQSRDFKSCLSARSGLYFRFFPFSLHSSKRQLKKKSAENLFTKKKFKIVEEQLRIQLITILLFYHSYINIRHGQILLFFNKKNRIRSFKSQKIA